MDPWEITYRRGLAEHGHSLDKIERWALFARIEKWVEERAGSLSGEARAELQMELIRVWEAGRKAVAS